MTAPTRTCTSCETPIPDGAASCPACGEATPTGISRESSEVHSATRSDVNEAEYRQRLQRALGEGYELRELIGQGGFGAVYGVWDVKLEREVAVKALRHDLFPSPDLLERFQREAKAVAKLRHPNILPVYAVGEGAGIVFMVMPKVEGENLRAALDREHQLSVDDATRIATETAGALQAAHDAGIVHRDVKPENILLEGKERRVLLMDFGIAKATEKNGTALTGTGMLIGTPLYMSPEQASGEGEIDGRSDIYALGCVVYEMLAGQPPITGSSVQAIIARLLTERPPPLRNARETVSREMNAAVMKALSKAPADRFQAVAHFASALTEDEPANLSGLTIPLRTWNAIWSYLSTLARRRLLSVAGAALIAVLAFVLILQAWPKPLLGFQQRDWVVIADFIRPDADSSVARALSLALRTGLQESGYVNVLSKARVATVLELMRRPTDAAIDAATGREICQRAGVKGLVQPELAKLGERYLLSLSLVQPASGDVVDVWTDQSDDENLIGILDGLVQGMLGGLGESRWVGQPEPTPLARATTESLEALERYSAGADAWNAGRRHDAVQLYKEAVRLDPDFARAYADLGGAYASFLFHEPDSARHYFEQALSRLDRVGSRERNLIQARYHSSLGNHEEAIRHQKIHLEQYPDDAVTRYNLAWSYMQRQQYDTAIAGYREVLRVNPDDANSLMNIAVCLSEQSKPEEALGYYESAFDIRPEWAVTGFRNHQYGMLLVRVGQLEEAAAVFEQRLEQVSPDERGGAHRSLGQLALRRGRIDQAGEHFRQAAMAHASAGSLTSAARDKLWWAIGETVRGNLDVAGGILEQAADNIQTRSGWLWLRARIAGAFVRADRVTDARLIAAEIEDWAEGHDRNEARIERAVLNAELASAAGEHGLAFRVLDSLSAVAPGPQDLIWEALANLYLRTERWNDAASILVGVIERRSIEYEWLMPWILAHYELAQVYETLEQPGSAVTYYSEFIDLWSDADPELQVMVDQARERLASLVGESGS